MDKRDWLKEAMAAADNPRSVPEILVSSAKTFASRNATYGDSYKHIGRVLKEMMPEMGMVRDKADDCYRFSYADWNRLFLLMMVVGKMDRYAAQLGAGGHKDSAHDAIVYSAMLEELSK